MDKGEIRKYIKEKGYLQVRVMFEMLGKPKKHIEKTIKKYMEKVKANPEIEVYKVEFADPKAQDDDMWSTYAETEMLVKSMEKLTWISLNFMPASIEIIKPEKKTYTNKELSFWVNDVLSRLHEVSLMTKSLTSKDKYMAKTLGTLLKNMVLLGLGKQTMNPKQIHKRTGIKKEEIVKILKVLVKQGKVKKIGDDYKRVK